MFVPLYLSINDLPNLQFVSWHDIQFVEVFFPLPELGTEGH
uniref:Uncharacterized protein n=1 Tax=Arundo donax TaxID=35708 RepID=A0A0A8YTM5_ARUDO